MSTDPRRHTPVAFIAWSQRTDRADEIAAALGGVARRFTVDALHGAATAPLRYLLNAVRTLVWLGRSRPGALIVQNPPSPAGYVAFAYARAARIPIVLDSHPSSFGRKGSRRWALLVPLHRWLARRVDMVLVTVRELMAEVERWGGRAMLVHEAPPVTAPPEQPPPRRNRPRVLLVSVFAADEPVTAAVAAARSVPDVTLAVTGDTAKAPPGLVRDAPGNVEFVGFLGAADYARALVEADALMVLTTDRSSVVRAGYEAVYAGRPLIVSDTPVLREVFPHAVHVANETEALAGALRRAGSELDSWQADTPAARALQSERWEGQLQALRAVLNA
jgi:glycosyltransferase involved in cell wall biosynthesis